MTSIQNQCVRKYNRITLENRQNLIRLVLNEHLSISKAANKIGLKLSTAKLIVKKYKQTGILFQKKMDRINRGKEGQNPQCQNRSDLAIDMQVNQIGQLSHLSISQPLFHNHIAQQYLVPTVIEAPYYIFNYFPNQIYWI